MTIFDDISAQDSKIDFISHTPSSSSSVSSSSSAQITKEELALNSLLENYGNHIAVKLTSFNSNQDILSWNSEQEFVTASIYKLLMIYPLILKINAGIISWDTLLLSDTQTIQSCVDKMIRYSDNDCAIAIKTKVQSPYIDQQLTSLGLKNTILNNSDAAGNILFDMHTTADDIAYYIQKVFFSDFLDTQTQSMILEVMNQQVYRQGIPSGIPSAQVYDKVGFLDEYLNDAAIVIDNNGNKYILVILTRSDDTIQITWQDIANIAEAVYSTIIHEN